MLLEKCQRAAPGESCGFRVISSTHVAIESMACALVPVDFNVWVCGADLLDVFGRNVRVKLAKMELNGRSRCLGGKVANAARVLTDNDVRVKPRG